MVRLYSKRITGVNYKIDAVIRFLSTGVYRSWFWRNYKIARQQEQLRREWREVCFRFELQSITEGLAAWVTEHGTTCPPVPETFAQFLAPKLTPDVVNFITESRAKLL